MLEFKKPIPVIVEDDKPGYAIYVTNGGTLENDIWCVTFCEGGIVRHYRSDQIRIHYNATFNITPPKIPSTEELERLWKMIEFKDKWKQQVWDRISGSLNFQENNKTK